MSMKKKVEILAPAKNLWQGQMAINAGADAVYIGGADVTISNGLKLLKQDSLEITLHQANTIYCVSSKSEHIVSWIAQKL